jgi:hypothetical protein
VLKFIYFVGGAPYLSIYDKVPYPGVRWLLYVIYTLLSPVWLLIAGIMALAIVTFEKDR